jgi:hypothetical protein
LIFFLVQPNGLISSSAATMESRFESTAKVRAGGADRLQAQTANHLLQSRVCCPLHGHTPSALKGLHTTRDWVEEDHHALGTPHFADCGNGSFAVGVFSEGNASITQPRLGDQPLLYAQSLVRRCLHQGRCCCALGEGENLSTWSEESASPFSCADAWMQRA